MSQEIAKVNPVRDPVAWLDPTEEMRNTARFEAVWQCIKDWDINVPRAYSGYMGATGNHVRAILDALVRGDPSEQERLRLLQQNLCECPTCGRMHKPLSI